MLGVFALKLRARSRELALARARTSAIVDDALDGIVVTDDKAIIAGFNRAAERIFGYRPEEVLGRNIKILMPEPYHSEHDGYVAAYKATEKPKVIGKGREVVGRRKDGTVFPMDLAIGESRIGDRHLFAGFIRDITDRKRSDQLLKDSEAKSRAILETAADAIITIDERGTILTANPAAERIFGYMAAEMTGHDISMLMPEPYRVAHKAYLKRYAAPGLGNGAEEVLGRRKDGSGFPAELAVAETHVAGTRIFTEIVRDISARKRIEDDLRESEERFRLLVDNIRDYAIITIEVDGTVKSWNMGSQRIYGWAAEEVVGRPMSVLFGEDAVKGAENPLAHVREAGRIEGEGWRIRKDGSRFWGHVIITPLWDEHGHMRGFVRICRDVTEQMEAESALRAAKEAAELANHAKTKFLAAASHDLRQPVQALFLQAAALEARMGEPDKAAPILTHVKGSLAALNGLLEALLDVSKLEAGTVKPQVSTFPLSETVEQIVAEFEPLARSKGLVLKMAETTAVVRTDASLFGRILRNLVANAIRYTRRGKILVGCHPHGQTLSVEVLDTGIGIAKEKLDDIFQEFYQVGNSERDRDQGLGLGLAIVRRLARLLDCPVSVRSTEGKGSAFTVQVPLAGFSRAKNIASLGATTQHPATERGLIFVIDDENTVLNALQLIIADWGYDVVTAHTEDEAMVALAHQSRPPDVVIADYRLRAGQTGADVIAHIRQRYDRAIPSIVITGDTAPERIREAEAHGLRLLHKPVVAETLKAEIARHVR